MFCYPTAEKGLAGSSRSFVVHRCWVAVCSQHSRFSAGHRRSRLSTPPQRNVWMKILHAASVTLLSCSFSASGGGRLDHSVFWIWYFRINVLVDKCFSLSFRLANWNFTTRPPPGKILHDRQNCCVASHTSTKSSFPMWSVKKQVALVLRKRACYLKNTRRYTDDWSTLVDIWQWSNNNACFHKSQICNLTVVDVVEPVCARLLFVFISWSAVGLLFCVKHDTW